MFLVSALVLLVIAFSGLSTYAVGLIGRGMYIAYGFEQQKSIQAPTPVTEFTLEDMHLWVFDAMGWSRSAFIGYVWLVVMLATAVLAGFMVSRMYYQMR